MASDAAQLVVRLEARLNTFERQLKQAGVLADKQAGEIEERFSRANLGLSTAIGAGLGTIVGGLATAATSALLRFVDDFAERLRNLQSTAKLTGIALQDLFGIQQDAAAYGLTPDETNKGLTSLARLLDRAKRGEENSLAKLFSANDIDVRKVQDVAEAYARLADLVQNARSELQKVDIAEAGGFGAGSVASLERGAQAVRDAAKAAADGAPDLEQLGRLAEDFDQAWKTAIDAIKRLLLQSFAEMRGEVAEFVSGSIRELQALGAAATRLRNFFGREGRAPLDDFAQSVAGSANRALEAAQERMRRLEAERSKPEPDRTSTFDPRRRATNLPDLGRQSGSSSGPDPDRFFNDQLRRTRDRSEDIALETRMLGANTEERIKAKAALDLQQAARRGEITLTGEQMRQLEAESAALGRVTAAYESARQRMSQGLALQNFAGSEIIDALDGMILRGEKLSDVFRNVAQSIARAALQAAILGQGPFAGLFGTAAVPGSGNAGGLIGMLMGGIGKNAAGTDNWRGGLSLVGEEGPELVNLPRGAQVIPNDILRKQGGGGSSVVIQNYTGQPVETRQVQGPQGPRTEVQIGEAINRHLLSDDALPVLKRLGLKNNRFR